MNFTLEEAQAFNDAIRKPTDAFSGVTIYIGALYILCGIAFLTVLLILIFKQRFSLLGYIVYVLTFLGAYRFLTCFFPLEISGFWNNELQRIMIPFYDTAKYYFIAGGVGADKYVMSTVLFFGGFLLCSMCVSLGTHLLNKTGKSKFPIIFSMIVCVLYIVKMFFDADNPGDIGIIIVSLLGVWLGMLISKAVSPLIKNKLLKREREIF